MNVEKLGSEILRLVADALEDGEKHPFNRPHVEDIWERMKAQAKTRAATYERPKFEDTNEIDDLRENHRIERNDLRAQIIRLHDLIETRTAERDEMRLEREKATRWLEHRGRAHVEALRQRDALLAELKQLRTENATHFLQRNELLNAAQDALSVAADLHPDLNLERLAAVVERIDKS